MPLVRPVTVFRARVYRLGLACERHGAVREGGDLNDGCHSLDKDASDLGYNHLHN